MTIYSSSFSQIITPLILCTLFSVQIYARIDAKIDFEVEGSGFHRTLIYHVHLKNFTNKDCHAAIYVELPSVLYINVNDIAELRRQRTNIVCSIGEVDVELFMENASKQNVTTCASINSSSCSLMIPLHQRYQYARETDSYIDVIVPKPKLLLGCRKRIKDHRVSKTDLCKPCENLVIKWREIPYRMSNDHDYTWSMPIGDSSLSMFVTYTTLLTTLIGAIFTGCAIRNNASNNHQKTD